MKIELKVKCFNPGCDISLSVEETDIAFATALSIISDEAIKLMKSRELKNNNETLTIGTSDHNPITTSQIKF